MIDRPHGFGFAPFVRLPAFASVLVMGVFLAAAPTGVGAQDDPEAGKFLTVDRIYGKSEFGAKAVSAKWIPSAAGTSRYVVKETVEGEPGMSLVGYDAATGEKEVLVSGRDLIPPKEAKPLSVSDHFWTKDLGRVLIFTNTKRVWRANTRGDYWVLDRASGQLHKLGGDATPSSLMYAKFSPTGDSVAYVLDGDVYLEKLGSGEIRRVTQRASPRILNGMSDWVYEEEFRLRDGFRWSPDGSKIAYWKFDTTGVSDFTMINNTDSLYPQTKVFAYPKAGTLNSAVQLFIVDIPSGVHRRIEMPGDARENYLPRIQWVEKTGELLVRQLNRLQNTETLTLVDFDSLTKRAIFSETDDAWIDLQTELFFLRDSESFLYQSDRAGWRQLYRVEVATGKMTRLTNDNFDVMELLGIRAQADGEPLAYIISSPDSATERFLYSVGVESGKVTRVTPADSTGVHTYTLSDDGQFAIHNYSTTASPPVTELVELPSHKTLRTLEDNQALREKLDALGLPLFVFFQVDTGETTLDGWRLNPTKPSPSAKHSLLVHVYGEPAGSTVMNRWMGTTGLWHQMLAQRGIMVVSMDNRGTKVPRGREFRKSVYRRVGTVGPNDQAAAVASLLEQNPEIDPERVGVWGWSGGGTSTLHAMFRHGDRFKVGLAVAPVANLAYYDTIYQERYMGLPTDNVKGYRMGSAIHFADQLEGELMVIHGTADDNVHYQATEKLVNTLVENNKQIEMFIYPNRSHSVSEGRGTAMHLRTMMTRFLSKHLLK